jgi:hypothetical protein
MFFHCGAETRARVRYGNIGLHIYIHSTSVHKVGESRYIYSCIALHTQLKKLYNKNYELFRKEMFSMNDVHTVQSAFCGKKLFDDRYVIIYICVCAVYVYTYYIYKCHSRRINKENYTTFLFVTNPLVYPYGRT